MEVDCEVKELLSVWYLLYYVGFYSMTSTLNDDFSANKMDLVGKEEVIEMFKKGFTYQQVSDELKKKDIRENEDFLYLPSNFFAVKMGYLHVSVLILLHH